MRGFSGLLAGFFFLMGESLEGHLVMRRTFVVECIAGKDLDAKLECYMIHITEQKQFKHILFWWHKTLDS